MVLGYYHSKDHPRESSSKALKFDLEAVRPDPLTPLEEYRVGYSFLAYWVSRHWLNVWVMQQSSWLSTLELQVHLFVLLSEFWLLQSVWTRHTVTELIISIYALKHAVGGLLNATFGNATELIISIYALKHGLIRVVQQSLLGSILSNMLLVLGCAFFCGGLVYRNKEQVFNKGTAVVNSGLLLMAVMGLLFPAVLHFTHTEVHFGKSELALSRFSSCIMLIAYAAYLYYQLKTQNDQYVPLNEGEGQAEETQEDDEVPEISKWESIVWLSVLTTWISILSEYLVDAIQGASVAWNMPIAFISVILLPIVGNAAEHASAIMFAMKDKLDISLGVAIGSSTQISMFGIPFSVVIGWIMGRPMDLNFQLFETATLFITVLVVAFLLQEGTSNYFKGLMLILCYLIVAASFFVHVDPTSVEDPQIKT